LSESLRPSARIRPALRRVPTSEATPAPIRPSDDELMAGLAVGDLTALEALYDRYGSLVFSVGLRVLLDRQLAEDVTQEVFLRLWRRPWAYNPDRGRFISWLMSVSRNRAIDERRRLNRRHVAEDRGDDTAPELPDLGRLRDPLTLAVLADQRREVLAALDQLPAAQREVLELAYFAGLTQTEIAARTGEALGTVKTRVRLGMQKLRGLLSNE
jgi:RNA polymerase sigma-70 factor, ECF subfamily